MVGSRAAAAQVLMRSTLAMIANRRRLGTRSRKISSRLPARSGCWFVRPVTLPSGRARFAIRPVPAGSPSTEDAAAFRSASDNRSGGEAFSSGAWLAAPALRAIKLDCGRSPVSQLEIVVFELDRPVGEPVFESSAKQPTNWPSSFRWGSSAPHYLAPSRRRPSGAPSTIVRATRAAGSQPYLPSGFQGRCKTATLHAGLGVIRGMSGNVCIGQPDGAQRAI